MKVAIMGAGLSGLSCAITLEKNGISPTIFEKRSKVGDRFVCAEALLSVLHQPIDDFIAYFSEKHGIYLRPTSNIKELHVYSPNEHAVIHGHLGFVNIRGRESDSFEQQLATQVRSDITYNSENTYEELLRDFTHVVMATGDASYAMKVQDFQKDLSVSMKGATVEGEFNRYSVYVWLDDEIAPKGYGYLLPFSEKEANIVIAYPDYPENQAKDIDTLWDKFYHLVCQTLDQQPRITDQFQIREYIIGICRNPRIGNTFFTGNCFGAIMPFLGFGQLTATLTGVYAAHDLCRLGKYVELTKPSQASYQDSLVLRRAMEKMDNTAFDILVKGLSGYWGERIFNSRRLNPLKLMSYLLRPLVKQR